MRSTLLLTLLIAAVATGAPAATAPFDVTTGRPIVQLSVNGKGPYPFVLDTGAPGLIVRQALVDELGLEHLGTTEVTSPIGGTPLAADRVRVDSVALAGAEARDLEATVIDLGGAALGMGVVGPAVFRGHGPLSLDFERNELTLGPQPEPEGVTTWMPFGPSEPLLDAPVRIGELTIDGHIDTGSPGVLAVPSGFAERLPLTGPVRTVGMARTVDAEFEIRAAAIATDAKIGDAQIPLTEIHIAELPVANLGAGGLRGLTLYVNWEGERFALTGAAAPVSPHSGPRTLAAGSGPRFGLRARPLPDGEIEVAGTEPGSAAEAIGLLAGDRIVAVNGKPVAELGHAEVRAELAEPGLVLRVEREGETIELGRPD